MGRRKLPPTRRKVPEPSGSVAMPPAQRDPRRWIYGGLDVVFAAGFAVVLVAVVPNRMFSAQIHLWSFPVLTVVMGAGTLAGNRAGWRIAVAAGSLVIASTIGVIIRLLTSAAFLSGVYGSFGTAAAMSSLLAVALIVELVALLPIVQLKYLMSRDGRRAYRS
ncbi:MAG: hypothetical protein AB7O24_20835 [Kofleriaceae bacterium]